MKASCISAKHIWIFSTSRISGWAVAVLSLLFIGIPCVYAEGQLVLEAKSQERVAGTFQYGGTPLRFELTKDKNPKKKRGAFSLRTLNNNQIFDANFGENGEYSAQYYGGRLSIKNIPSSNKQGIKATPPVSSSKGDTNALMTFVNSAEYKMIPYLSRELGKTHGITGNAFPVSLPIHMMALSVVNKYPNEYKLEDFSAADSKRSASSCSDLRHDGITGCFGMCGRKCGCWEWVCGDCCCHTGCREHDQACRDCAWYHPDPIACTRCAVFDFGNPYSQCSICKTSSSPIVPNCGDKYCNESQKCCQIGTASHCVIKSGTCW